MRVRVDSESYVMPHSSISIHNVWNEGIFKGVVKFNAPLFPTKRNQPKTVSLDLVSVTRDAL